MSDSNEPATAGRDAALDTEDESLGELHAATRRLLRADDHEDILTVAGEAASDVLGFPGSGVRAYDAETETLHHVALGGRVGDIESRPPYDVADSPHGRAFRRGETVVEDVPEDDRFDRDSFVQTMYVPLGEHGLLSVGKTDGAFTEREVALAEILAGNTTAVLDRAEKRRQLATERERLDEFASVVAHDLKNPLGAVRGFLDLVEDTGDTQYVGDARNGLDRMERLIDELLALARDGRTVDEQSRVGLAEVARDAWETADTGDLSLVVQGDLTVVADESRLERLLENLFANAATHADGSTTVTVGALAAGDDGADEDAQEGDARDGFYVADDGPGIPEGEQETVFETGYTTAPRGTGFGLAIVERIADAHGWTAAVTTGAAGGARFEFAGVTVQC
ncbi:sensor histidine kinase [Haloarchaeobius amylolyticus]|uniref:sensor histidine kinase n=1 Tax=Haloarchaeobius amylolyticus TaxID=1198296 RepID=UPI00226F7E9D|nr:GAF domain-containing sensor histidine kinase [Haloarchaeobius amylolyticus]